MNEPTPEPTPEPAPEPTPEPTPELTPTLTLEQMQKELEKARKDAASYRTKLREAEEAARQAALTDEEKRKEELEAARTGKATAEQKAQAIALQLSVERQARKLGIVDEDAAFRLLDTAAVEFDTDGNPTNVETLLKGMTETRPWLLGDSKPATSGGSSSAPGRQRSGGELTINDFKGMTAQQIADLDPEVRRAAMQRK